MQKTKRGYRLLATLLIITIAIGIFPVGTLAASESITVKVRAQDNFEFLYINEGLTVPEGIAEDYGFETNAEPGVITALDVLVCAHVDKYGSAFTLATADDYLTMSYGNPDGMFENGGYGYTKYSGFAVNHDYYMDDDGIGYSVDDAPVFDGDVIDFFYYEDPFWMDYLTWFTDGSGNTVDELTVESGELFTLKIKGYMYMEGYASPTPDDIYGDGAGMIQVFPMGDESNILGDITDAAGITLSFAEAGTYFLTAQGFESEYDAPIIPPLVKITVRQRGNPTTIQVYFTLYGDTDHLDTDQGGTIHTLSQGGLNTWIATKTVTISSSSKVAVIDVVRKVLTETGGFTWNDNGGVYISSITYNGVSLEAYTNGPNSGWMYTINDAFPDFGMNEQFLNDKDRIIVHYTDDWSLEDGSQKWVGGSSGTKKSIETEVEALITDGVAVVEIEPAAITKLIAEAKAKDAANIMIAVTTTGNEKAVEVHLIARSVNEIAQSGVGLTIKSQKAEITFSNDTLPNITGSAGAIADTVVKIIASTVDAAATELNALQQAAVGNDPVIDLSIWVGNTQIHDLKGAITVTIPYIPPESLQTSDYDLLTVYLLEADGGLQEMKNAKYAPVAGTITFAASHFSVFFVSEWISPFTDTSSSDWFYRAMRFAYSHELMNGTATGQFSPNLNLSRAMLVTILYRLENIQFTTRDAPFSDVLDGSWYSDAVSWAVENGVVDGYEDGTFRPDDSITREQFASVIYRYALYNGINVQVSEYGISYNDVGVVSSWAQDAMKWANASGLITGRVITNLAPLATATRAEAATIMQRFIEVLHYERF
ncbi:MAG: S-layer homology domain-containing protein [Oscillospiraceae bacterium]|nr:S-layer homology domain-containing protein [Oscillospiraceae bacterium]